MTGALGEVLSVYVDIGDVMSIVLFYVFIYNQQQIALMDYVSEVYNRFRRIT
jgi:hypothetical protein